MKTILTAAAFAVLGVSSVLAADLPARTYTKAPVMAPAYDWSGFYLGAQGGGAWSRSNYDLTQFGIVESLPFSPNSAIGGGHVGLQGQWGSWVLGVEGTYSATDLNQTDLSPLTPTNRSRSISTSGIATVVAKVGYASGPWMVYVKGGWADAKINISTFNPNNGVVGSTDGWQSGYTVGAGVDYMFARNWIIGADFNYYDLRFNRDALFSNGTPYNTTGKDTVYAGMLRLSYLFNWGGAVVAKY